MKKTIDFIRKQIATFAIKFVYDRHLPAIVVSGVILIVVLLLNLQIDPIVLIMPYLITQVVYTYNHFRELQFDQDSNPERVKYMQGRNVWRILIGYGALLFILLLLTNVQTFLFVSLIIVGGIFYTEYFKKSFTRYILGFKNFYTSLFIAMIIFLVPLFYEIKVTLFYVYFFLFIFLRFFFNTVFFDIKDIDSDRERKLKTFPVVFGKGRTIYLLHFINIAAFFPILLGVYCGNVPMEALVLMVSIFYGLYYLIHAFRVKGKDLRMLSYVVADAEFILSTALILIVKVIF